LASCAPKDEKQNKYKESGRPDNHTVLPDHSQVFSHIDTAKRNRPVNRCFRPTYELQKTVSVWPQSATACSIRGRRHTPQRSHMGSSALLYGQDEAPSHSAQSRQFQPNGNWGRALPGMARRHHSTSPCFFASV
jgi:hypothetical protein